MPMSERPSQPGLVWVLGVSGASRGSGSAPRALFDCDGDVAVHATDSCDVAVERSEPDDALVDLVAARMSRCVRSAAYGS
jgi:hypothetical protein